MEVTVVAF